MRSSHFFLMTFLQFSMVWISASSCQEKEPDFTNTELEFFETKIRPLLAKQCYECHGPKMEDPEGGLRFSSRGALIQGGESGPAIVPGQPDKSRMIQAINYREVDVMPPDTKLSQEEIDLLTEWVAKKAPWPAGVETHPAMTNRFNLLQRKEEHWSWQQPKSVQPPEVNQKDWPLDAIDHFILKKNEVANLSMATAANREVWIRRVYFDLIGLPPSPEEVQAFLEDQDENAFEKVVDQLLASEHYGERWARHWMDLIRYAETCGHEFEYPIPHAFRYRDYLIRAFNADVPYDQFVKEHVAGDLMANPRFHPEEKFNESILATGFWFLHEATHAPVDVRLDEANHTDNRIDVMSKSFLGLTVACARCHDHKFDAISTMDYYAMAGFLQSSRRQLAMLDPHGKIGESTQKIRRVRQSVNQQLRNAAISNPINFEEMADYLVAAGQRQFSEPAPTLVEGESLQITSNSAGAVDRQEMAPFGNQWSGNKQLFWLADREDGLLKMVLTVPQDNEYQFKISLTKAPDYGVFQVLIDGKKLGKPIDGYHGSVIRPAPIELSAKLPLKKGKHELAFQVMGTNPKANPKRYIVGVDYVDLVPLVNKSAATQNQPGNDEIEKLDPARIAFWKSELKSAIDDENHPLWLWQQVTNNGKNFDRKKLNGFHETLLKQQSLKKTDKNTKGADQELPQLFTDFDKPNFGDWFVTGEAFGTQPTANGHWDAQSKNGATYPAGMADGTRYSKKLHGVLRSPTFEIHSNAIWYRIKGENVKIRLIIDGFVMDVYNGLLFRGASINVNTKGEFQWVQQAGDIHRYKGHRAHIEIIDQGGGYAVVDKVVFGNGGKPPSVPSLAGRLIPSVADSANLSDFTTRYAKAVEELSSGGFFFSRSNQDLAKSLADGLSQIAAIEREIPSPILAPAMTDGTPEDEYVFIRGNHRNLGPVAERRFLEALSGPNPIAQKTKTSGRLILANQIASSENPLTGRVIVNRLWHHLFGRGIVPSVDNFGVLGQRPSHPELLDYLTNEFVANRWSIKRMLKRLVLTQTYRMSSRLNSEANEKDPNNVLLHRMSVRRLQGEAIRDSMLTVSGRLDATVYGASFPVHLTPFMEGRGRPGRSGPVDGNGRRSLYTEIRRNFLPPMLLAFDMPIPFNSIGNRNISNVPAQALILMNDPFVVGQAEVWAKRLIAEETDFSKRLDRLYQQAFARLPTEKERSATDEFFKRQGAELKIDLATAKNNFALWKDLCHVTFNVKEFIYLQ